MIQSFILSFKGENMDNLEKNINFKHMSSCLRRDDSIIERNMDLEKSFGIKNISFYYYVEQGDDVHIVGEVFAKIPLKQSFCFICTLYDDDGDIIESKVNDSYGSGVVTSMIKPDNFFDGFPFSFTFYDPKVTIARIKIVPAISY